MRVARLSTLRTLIATGVLLSLAVAADTLVWSLATNRLEHALGEFEAQMRAEGWRVQAGRTTRLGWPFQALLAVPAPAVEGAGRILPGGLSWHADRLLLGLSLWHPFTLRLLPEGVQELRISRAPPVVFAADRLLALVPLGEARPDRLDLEAGGLTGGLAASAHKQDVRLGTLSLRLADGPRGHTGAIAAHAVLRVEQLDLPDTRRWPLGARVARLSLEADLASPALEAADPLDQARAWRDGGGSLGVRELAIRWGPLAAQSSAVLRLDQRLQPAGSGRARLVGYEAALDALAAGGAISGGLATTAKAVLGLMAPGSGPAGLELPFTLTDSTLSVGKIPLVRLSDVLWETP